MTSSGLVDPSPASIALRRLTVALCALAVLIAASSASAQDPILPDTGRLPDVGAALEMMLFAPPIVMGAVTLVGGVAAELTHKGRQVWFVGNVILASINTVLTFMALTLALEEPDGIHHAEHLGYAAALGSAGLADTVMAIILRLDMDDERWPRPIALRDVNGGMLPGLGFRGTF